MSISGIPGRDEPSREKQELTCKEIEDFPIRRKDCMVSATRDIVGEGDDDFPALTFDNDDGLWIVWSSCRKGKDSIRARRYDKESRSEEYQVSSAEGKEFQCAAACDATGAVWFGWSAKRNGEWQIMVRSLEGNTLGEEFSLDAVAQGCFNPFLLGTSDGSVWAAWERVVGGKTHIALRCFDGHQWGNIMMISDPGMSCYRPCLVEGTGGAIWCAWDGCAEQQGYDIFLRGYRQRAWLATTQVTRHAADDFHPSLTADGEGRPWIAWASNREQKDRWNLSRWIYLWRYDGRRFYYPARSQVGRDLSKKKVDQSWEFPATVVDRSGRIWLFGRASHCFYGQNLSGEGWSDLIRLGDAEWACRGQRIRTAIDTNGDIYLAWRGISGIEVAYVRPKEKKAGSPSLHKVRKGEKRVALSNSSQARSRHVVELNGEKLNVYFGDLHGLTSHSDGLGEADEYYTRCRDIYKLDFGIVADHEEFCGKKLGRAQSDYLWAMADLYCQAEKFVTFHAYEWTGAAHPGPGHHLVIFPGEEGEVVGRSDSRGSDLAKLLQSLKSSGAIVVPLHIGWTGVDAEKLAPDVQPIVELCSAHGAYEFEDNKPIPHRSDNVVKGCFVRDLLGQGLKFGFCAGSSGHGLRYHHGACWRRDSWRTGYTGVFAEQLTREDIFQALKNRRCYATSGERIFLDFRINGHLMGEEFETDEELELSVTAEGVHRIWTIEFISNGDTIRVEKRRKRQVSSTFTLPPPEKGTSYHYVRIHQSRDEMAWSSPIWVTPKKA